MTLFVAWLAGLLYGVADLVAGSATAGPPESAAEAWRVVAAALSWSGAAPLVVWGGIAGARAARGGPRRAAVLGAAFAAPCALYAAATMAEGPGVGRFLAGTGGAATFLYWLLRAGFLATTLAGGALLGAALARPASRPVRASRGAALLGAGLAAHLLILPGLYPAFRFATLFVAFVGAVDLAAACAAGRRLGFARTALALAVCGFPGLWLFATDPETRAGAVRRLPATGAWWQAGAPLLPAFLRDDAGPPRRRIEPWPPEMLSEARRKLLAAGLPERPSVLLLTIDAVRADKTGAAGGAVGYTPRLDALAENGWTCRRAYAPASLTFPTVAAMMRGIAPDRVALLPDPDAVPRLAEVFGAAGYRTYAGFPAEAVFFGKEIGKDFSRGDLGFGAVDVETRPDDERLARLFAFLDEDRARPFFAWVHLMGPHAPYTPAGGPRFGRRPSELYLAEVAEADARLGAAVDRLAAAGHLARTVLCVASDHGEAFGERGTFFHGLTVYDEEVRVPLVLAGPGLAPARIDAAVSLLDLMPTFLHMAGLDTPEYLGGRSAAPLALGLADGRDRVALVVHRHPSAGAAWKAAVRPPWKAIKNERTGAVELFHLERDPGERSPLRPPFPTDAADVIEILNVPPIPVSELRGEIAARRAEVEAAAKFGRLDDPRWERFLGDASSVVRTAAADALASLAGDRGDDLLRRFALAPGPATEAERLRALSLVNRRPRWTDFDHEDDRVRYSVAFAAARDTEGRLGEPPYDVVRRRIATEANPNVLCELLLVLDRAQVYGDQRVFERTAARDDVAGARAAALLALRRLGEGGLKRPGEKIVDRTDVVPKAPDELTVEVEVPALSAAQVAAGPPLLWVVFGVPGRDGKELEPFVERGEKPWPFRSHVIEYGTLLALRPTSEPLRIRVVGAKVRPEFLCALFIEHPER